MKRKTLILVVLTAIIWNGTVYASSYMNGLPAVDQIEKAMKSLLVIETKGDGVALRGIAVHLGDGYILSLTHTTNVTHRIDTSPYGSKTKVESHTPLRFYVTDTEIYLIGREADISIFKHPYSESLKTFPLKFGQASNLRLGNKLLMLGFSFNWQFNIKEGIVSSFDVNEKDLGALGGNTFLAAIPTNPGDSGSVVLAFNIGKANWELIGLVQSTGMEVASRHIWTVSKAEAMSFILTAEYVQETIRKIFNR